MNAEERKRLEELRADMKAVCGALDREKVEKVSAALLGANFTERLETVRVALELEHRGQAMGVALGVLELLLKLQQLGIEELVGLGPGKVCPMSLAQLLSARGICLAQVDLKGEG
jgi:hypothetical protein